jgi:hypothetical protein
VQELDTALIIAARRGFGRIVRVLLSNGANFRTRNKVVRLRAPARETN